MKQEQLIPHLFRNEFSKITAVLVKLLGVDRIEAAEDIASDTFLSALETWSYKGVPANPTAWLYHVAKNKAKNYLGRHNLFNGKISTELKLGTAYDEVEIDLSEQHINDSQLQMLFALCHPAVSAEAQIALSLRLLCGFSIDEIADAFLSNKETISKRLVRAKEKLREEKVKIEMPPEGQLQSRLQTVLTTLYLLFNEGYYSESQDVVIREELCLEAMRLTYLLIQPEPLNVPDVNALLSLMCFHSSRFAARKDNNGELILYDDQDEALWNHDLIAKGAYYLRIASQGNHFSKYHVEAAIAYWHTVKADTNEKWENILHLYNQLLKIEYSPIAALNRTFALAKVYGAIHAIKEAEQLQLLNNHYYFFLLGQLYTGVDSAEASINFQKALSLAKTIADRRMIESKIKNLMV